jgi:glycosyltransferase involved in cell wall biosynthesis
MEVNKTNPYNGGGWISSAEKCVRVLPNVELGLGFKMDNEPFMINQNGVNYYPIPSPSKSKYSKIKHIIRTSFLDIESKEETTWAYYLNCFKKIIEDFSPDIIHVWGSEYEFGLIHMVAKMPVVLHLQGIINPCLNALLPPFVSWNSFMIQSISPFSCLRQFIEKQTWQKLAFREKVIFAGVKNYLGRTNWDNRVRAVMSPNSNYYHVDEVLRDEFYEDSSRKIPTRLTIITTISQPLYKGFDLVLKTAYILKHNLHLDFEWKCFGDIDPIVVERMTGITHDSVNVFLKGVANSQQLKDEELNATLYFHSSYIDNSPNSLCEAQILGLPVVSTNVGGIPSLVKEGETGYLIPSNDPYQASFFIQKLYNNKDLNVRMGERAKEIARVRHDKNRVIQQILDAYNSILN